ncbi:MAG: phosphodiester glycosidase family protein, partial [Roseiarcus sp.]
MATLTAFLVLGLGPANGTASAGCAAKDFESAKFIVCTFDPAHDDIRLFLSEPDDKPYGSLAALAAALKAKGEELIFAMNAGMFGQDQFPVGLYVEDRRKLHAADTRGGATNFHLKPNGVFWIGDKVAGVTETSRYLANTPPTRYATQSGPMLVVEGKIHPKIRPNGTSLKIRNGVGACNGGAVVFAIADEPVTFDAFARLFRDALDCRNALFLDGSVSSLYAPELNRDDELGPI